MHQTSAQIKAAHRPPVVLTTSQLLRISALWFGLQFFWVSQQMIVMPERIRHFVPIESVGTWYGLIKSCGAVVVILTQLTIGFISDHTHSGLGRRRPFVIHGVLWGCAGITFFILAPGYWWLFAAYMVIEGTINVASVPFQSLLPDLVPQHQHSRAGSIMGQYHLFGNLVGLLAVIMMELVFAGSTITLLGDVKPLGYVWLLAGYLVLLLGTAAVVVFGIDEDKWRQKAQQAINGTSRAIRILPGAVIRFAVTAPTLLGCIINDYRKVELRSQPNFVWLSASRFTIFLGYQTFLTYIAYYVSANLDSAAWMASLGLDSDALSHAILPAILVFFILGGLAGTIASAPLSERFGKKVVIRGGMVIAGLMVIPLILTSNVWTAIGCGMLLGSGWGAFIAADWSFACTLMPKEKAGSYMGIWDVTTLMPQVLAPVIAAPIRDGIFKARQAELVASMGEELGQRTAEALAHQWLYATIILYFILGIWLLMYVKEPGRKHRDLDVVEETSSTV